MTGVCEDARRNRPAPRACLTEETRDGTARRLRLRSRAVGQCRSSRGETLRAQGTYILDHGKARGPRGGKAAPEPIDVGDDPPLFVDGEPADIIDRRRVSVQWFSGTVLTGLCGAALM